MEMRGVAFRYARTGPHILRGVDLAAQPGSVVEVTGRNGSGKSTLLKLFAGVLSPTRGVVHGPARAVGYAPERFPTGQAFTVAAYLAHMARLQGVRRERARRDVGVWAERLGCAHLMRTRLGQLSKGSAQKVGIMQALLPEPDVLILDEPFAGLDVGARQELGRIVTETAARGGIVLVSDHQRCLGQLTERTRWHADSGGVTAAPVAEEAGSPAGSPTETVTFEVTVSTDEAQAFAARLQAQGYRVRDARTEAQETERLL